MLTALKRSMIGLLALTYSLCGCATFPGAEVVLPDPIDDAFRAVTGHEGITLSDRLIVYGSEDPPSARMQCHERYHQADARRLGDAAVEAGAIDDTVLERAAYWLLIYSAEHARHGYRGNRFEERARAACP